MRVLLPLSCACALMLAACGGSSSTAPTAEPTPTPTPEPTYRCAATHTPPAGYHIQKRDDGSEVSVEICKDDPDLSKNGNSKVQIHNGHVWRTPNDDNSVDVRFGEFTGYMTGIGDHDHGVLSFYILFHCRDVNNHKQNIHAGLWGPQPMNNRLVRHWWSTDNAWPDITKTQNNYRFDPSKTYQFHAIWTDSRVDVTICEGANKTEAAANAAGCKTQTQYWKGGQKKFDMQGFLFGNKLLKGFSFGNNVQVQGLRFTVFEAD
ncbi:MAG: hypothetical protein HQK87_04845 [Nitrospinae bacterium]|nr:hypothetical protein [Nitrospinota bacterium]